MNGNLDIILKDIEDLLYGSDKTVNTNLVLAKIYYALLILAGKS